MVGFRGGEVDENARVVWMAGAFGDGERGEFALEFFDGRVIVFVFVVVVGIIIGVIFRIDLGLFFSFARTREYRFIGFTRGALLLKLKRV